MYNNNYDSAYDSIFNDTQRTSTTSEEIKITFAILISIAVCSLLLSCLIDDKKRKADIATLLPISATAIVILIGMENNEILNDNISLLIVSLFGALVIITLAVVHFKAASDEYRDAQEQVSRNLENERDELRMQLIDLKNAVDRLMLQNYEAQSSLNSIDEKIERKTELKDAKKSFWRNSFKKIKRHIKPD